LSDKSISICNINIRGIRNKINFLQNFVDEFDIIVLTETHLDNSIENRDIELDSFDNNPPITFLKLKSLIISINLLLFKDIRLEFRSPEITIFSLT
jgi:hypothetical protein